MPRVFLESDAGFPRRLGYVGPKRRSVANDDRTLAEDVSTEIRPRWEVQDRERDYSPMNDLNIVASLGILGLILIMFADLLMLGLI